MFYTLLVPCIQCWVPWIPDRVLMLVFSDFFTNFNRMDFAIYINWMSPFPILGLLEMWGYIFCALCENGGGIKCSTCRYIGPSVHMSQQQTLQNLDTMLNIKMSSSSSKMIHMNPLLKEFCPFYNRNMPFWLCDNVPFFATARSSVSSRHISSFIYIFKQTF